MLSYIHVKNLALIKDVEMDLSSGLNVLSGETGAGKSILLGSVNLALGCRAEKDWIRTGESFAFVELVFMEEDPKVLKALQELDIEAEDGQIVISRRISEGKSISKINGETVTNARLKAVAALLIDIHGQHDHQSLLDEGQHLAVLDAYGKNELAEVKTAYQAGFQAYRKIKEKIKALGVTPEEAEKRLDFLNYEIAEIQGMQLVPGEDQQLEIQFSKLSNSREILENLSKAKTDLEEGVSNQLSRSIQSLQKAAQFDTECDSILKALADMESVLQDTLQELSAKAEELSYDESTFQKMERRIDALESCKRKYGTDIAGILKLYEEKQKEANALKELLENRGEIVRELEEKKKDLIQAGKALHEKRVECAAQFDELMKASLMDLNFLSVNFKTEILQSKRYTVEGADEARFLISMNLGEDLKPLSKVASGGELSRIMLTLKDITAKTDEIHTLIFDEIDTGISGKTGAKVAEKMHRIAQNHQVICISHLPQIVAMADQNYLIEKSIQEQETQTRIRQLSEEESYGEIARLLGTGEITKSTLQSAKELKTGLKREEN